MKVLLIGIFIFNSAIAFSAEKKSCGVRETAAALATIDADLDFLESGLYSGVRDVSMRKIAGIVKKHLQNAQTCDVESASLKKSAIDTIDELVLNNTDNRDYSINTAKRICKTIRASVVRMDEVAASYLDDLIVRANH